MLRSVEEYAPVRAVLDELRTAVTVKPGRETVATRESFGRVASRDLAAAKDAPPMPLSHMDGYAVVSASFAGADEAGVVTLKLRGEVRLGSIPRMKLERGEAVRVATGSLLPAGADAVVPAEQADVAETGLLAKGRVERGQFVFERGADVPKGTPLLKGGTKIRAQDLAMLISVGVGRVHVYARPRVGVLATGNELTNSLEAGAGMVRNSHSPLFLSLLESLGCEPVDLGISPDDPARLFTKLKSGLQTCEMVLTTGGTSVGKLDVLGEAVRRLRPSVSHHGIRMDRGRVTGVAVVKGRPLVMMPGPVQGAMNAFLLFAVPLARRLSGLAEPEAVVKAKLSSRWEARKRFPNFTKVVYVSLSKADDGWVAEPRAGETESMSLLTNSCGFVVVPEETTSLEAGAEVEVLLVPGYSWAP